MHDGSLATLDEVIEFYAAGGSGHGTANPLESPFLAGFVLQLQRKQDLIAFLQSLTDRQFLNSNINLPDCLKTKECKGKRTLVSS